MRFQQPGPGPGRDDVAEVMSRPEFQYPKSAMERVGEWIAERLNRVFDGGAPEVGGATTFSAGFGTLLGWLVLALAVAAIVVVVVLVVRRWIPAVKAESDEPTEAEVEHRRRASEWSREAMDHEAKGEWKLAMRARFRELVRTLVDREQVADLPGRTTGELLADVAVTTPSAVDDFHTACLLFELPWYADQPTGEEENRRIRRCTEAVLSAPVEGSLAGEPVAVVGRVREMPGEADG